MKKSRHDFTLIELLVVIAVIALLSSMFLTALGSARSTARRISCVNNLKNIGQAVMLYCTDNDTWLPPACGYGFATYYLNLYLRQDYHETVNMGDGTVSLRFKQMKGVYFCPAIDNPASSPLWTGTATLSLYFSSYHASMQSSSYNNPQGCCWALPSATSRKLDSIYGNSVLVCDRAYMAGATSAYTAYTVPDHADSWQYSTSTPQYAPAFIHNGNRCNFLFRDMHVESYKYTGQYLFNSQNYTPR